MGLIRVSDETEQRIKEIKGAKSVGAAVDDLLTKNDIAARLDKLATYLEGKFASLEKKLDDTTVDRIATSPARKQKQVFITSWRTVQELLYEVATPDDYINPAVYDSFANSDMADEFSYYVQDNQIRYSWHGADFPILNLSPTITNFLTEKGVL